MANLTKYSSLWGSIPITAGQVFFVAPGASYAVDGTYYTASDSNDGLSPGTAFLTVNRGVNLATNDGDTVVLLPGDHTVTSSIAADSNNVTITGIPGPAGRGNMLYQKATLACSAVDETINVTGSNVEIAHIGFLSTTDQASALLNFSAAADALHIHHCMFDLFTATADTAILGIDAIGAANYVLIEDSFFPCDGAFGASVDMTGTLDSVVRRCLFSQQTGTQAATVTVGAGASRLLIDSCVFQISNDGVVTACIDGTGATIASGVLVKNCSFPSLSTIAIGNFSASECELAENYESSVGGGAGGVLVVAIA